MPFPSVNIVSELQMTRGDMAKKIGATMLAFLFFAMVFLSLIDL
jgi:hypothetical protein